jgi:hypothetical protein
MQGSWTVSVKSKAAAWKQRFIISGSSNGADGEYAGETSTAAVSVSGANWIIRVQHEPGSGSPWIDSDERLGTPVRPAGQVTFDLFSNDSGADSDFNDLVLTCEAAVNDFEYIVYGKVRSYSGLCLFNPCFRRVIVIDTAVRLRDLLKYKPVRAATEALYPDRVKRVEQLAAAEEEGNETESTFRPMMLPIEGGQRLAAGALKATARSPNQQIAFGSTAADVISSHALDLGRLKDRLTPICAVNDEPGLALRFQEYDRTAAEQAGGPYTGEGPRQNLGFAVTDSQGNYIFRFSQSLADIQGEVDEGGGLRPDLIIQAVSGLGGGLGVLCETAVYNDIPNFRRINLCFPNNCLNPGPAACQGGRAIQAIGNISILSTATTQLDGLGRVTSSGLVSITKGAWFGSLHVYACFLEHPSVERYTIEHRRDFGAWTYVAETYKHEFISQLANPNHPAHKVGPFDFTLSGGSVVPAYKNIEADGNWVATHRLRKIILNSHIYASISNPGSVQFRVRGYDAAGSFVSGASDHITLFIDNRAVAGDVDDVSMGATSPGECALFDLPTTNEPLTMRFRAIHLGGFVHNYSVSVKRGSNTPVAVTGDIPLSMTYDQTVHGDSFQGTLHPSAGSPDADGYVEATLTPVGSWLPAGKSFCAFSFEVHGRTRSTNGFGLRAGGLLDKELVGISMDLCPPCNCEEGAEDAGG